MHIFLIVFTLLFALPAQEADPFPPATCEQLAAIYGAELVPINDDLPHGWDWVAEDMEQIATIYLGGDSTLEQWREAPARQLWLIHYFDHEATEEDGRLGLHHICVFRIPIARHR